MAKPPENPDHYDGRLGVTCISAIENAMTDDEYRGFLWGNIFKYVWRWPKKNGLTDLKKARWLLDKLIEKVESASPPKTE